MKNAAASLIAIICTTAGLSLAISQASAQEWGHHRDGYYGYHQRHDFHREHCELQPRRVMTPYGPRRQMVEVCYEGHHGYHRDWH